MSAATGRRRRILRLVAATVFGGAALCASLAGCARIRAGQLVRDATAPGIDLAPQIAHARHEVEGARGRTSVHVYRPADGTGPLPGFVLCHGAVDTGATDARLVRFAHALAVRGATVVTPELPALGRFRIDGAEPTRVADVAAWLAHDTSLCADGRVALLGISVGGAYCLVASGEERLRDRVSAVLAFGAYDDLESLVRTWMTDPAPAPGMLDPFTEGRRRVLLGNLERLVPLQDRAAVEAELRGLLAGRTPPHAAVTDPRSVHVLAAGRSRDPLDPELARALLAPLAGDLAALSPVRAGTGTNAPIYLLHGSNDPIVPTASVRALAAALTQAGAPVELHVTELFEHVDAGTTPGLWDAWPLLGFLADYLDDGGL